MKTNKEEIPVNFKLFKAASDSSEELEVVNISIVKSKLLETDEYEVCVFYKPISRILNF